MAELETLRKLTDLSRKCYVVSRQLIEEVHMKTVMFMLLNFVLLSFQPAPRTTDAGPLVGRNLGGKH